MVAYAQIQVQGVALASASEIAQIELRTGLAQVHWINPVPPRDSNAYAYESFPRVTWSVIFALFRPGDEIVTVTVPAAFFACTKPKA